MLRLHDALGFTTWPIHSAVRAQLGWYWRGLRVRPVVPRLELAYAFSDLVGAEMFIPLGVVQRGDETGGGIGDIELQAPKLSFVRRYGFVVTGYVAAVLPSGDPDSGLGEGTWRFAPHLLSDLAIMSFGLQMNLALEADQRGAMAAEARISLAHTNAVGSSPVMLLSPLCELGVEAPLARAVEQTAGVELLLVTSLKIAVAGYHLGAGVQLPLTGASAVDFRVLVQVGYHVRWNRLFAAATGESGSSTCRMPHPLAGGAPVAPPSKRV